MMQLHGELKQARSGFIIYPLCCCAVLKVGQLEDTAEDPAASKLLFTYCPWCLQMNLDQ